MPSGDEEEQFQDNVVNPLTNAIDGFVAGGGQAADNLKARLVENGLMDDEGN